MNHLRSLNSEEILNKTKALVAEERKLTTEILHLLRETERRMLHAERGYSSLHEYCVKELGYSDGAAYRRISAMRLIKDLPETEEALKTGKLTLTTASTLQSFLQAEKKERGKTYSQPEKRELMQAFHGQSKRECESILAAISPKAALTDRERVITPELSEVRFSASKDLMSKLTRIKEIWSHSDPNMSYETLLNKMADQVLEKIEPTKNAKPQKPETKKPQPPASPEKFTPTNRYIPAPTRRIVWTRDQGRCSYVDSKTGNRCATRHSLQLDHIHPYSLGGPSTPSNLRLLCRTHNLLTAKSAFGAIQMKKFVPSLR